MRTSVTCTSKAFSTSTRNLTDLTSKTVQAVNIIDLLNHDVILFTKDSLEVAAQHYTNAE